MAYANVSKWTVVNGHCKCASLTALVFNKYVKYSGLSADERDVASDLKDRVHAMFKSCETADELVSKHEELCKLIDVGKVPQGATRRRRAKAREGAF